MHERCVLVDPGKVVVDILLGGGVAPEVDRSGRSYSDKVRSKSPVHTTDTLIEPNMPEISQMISVVLEVLVLAEFPPLRSL